MPLRSCLVSLEYRDDLAAAEQRLASLDAAHAEKASVRRREALEERRARVSSKGVVRGVALAVLYVGLYVALKLLDAAARSPVVPASGFAPFAVSTLIAACAGAWLLFARHRERREHARIDAELRELAEPHVRIASTTLAEAVERIAEREAEAQAEPQEDGEARDMRQ